MTHPKKHPKPRAPRDGAKLSAILKNLPDQFPEGNISLGELRDTLSGRAYGILLLVLALPNLIPLPTPGLSAVMGAPLVLVTFQLMLGKKSPWLPGFIARRNIRKTQMKRVCTRISPYLEKLEYIIRPRLQFLTHAPAERFIALICVLLSLMILMPIPFGNALPALAISLFSIGILQRDGLFVVFGAVTTMLGATLISAFIGGLTEMIGSIFG